MAPNISPTSRDMMYLGMKHVIAEPITYAKENIIVDVLSGKLPAGAMVVGGGIFITTAFNDSGTDTIDVGFRDATTTDDPDAYATLLAATAVGYIALDELAATTNIRQAKSATLTWRYNGQNNDATAGAGYLIVEYVLSPTP